MQATYDRESDVLMLHLDDGDMITPRTSMGSSSTSGVMTARSCSRCWTSATSSPVFHE